MKRVLIITYYWPPAGGPGVQRWLKFTKYLPKYNISPVVYIPENPTYPILDKSLEIEISPQTRILKNKIKEPYRWAKLFSKKQTKTISKGIILKHKNNISLKILLTIRGNCFIPDARKNWISPSVKYLTKYIEDNPINVIISTGPPHSMHLIANQIKEKYPDIPWIADFRDPWTTIAYHKKLLLSPWAKKKHLRLEQRVLDNADYLVVTSQGTYKEFSAKTNTPIALITNGYDEIKNTVVDVTKDKNSFSLSHVGTLLSERNPLILWEVLKELCEENKMFNEVFELQLAGEVSEEVHNSISNYGLTSHLKLLGYLPHKKSVELMYSSKVLLLLEIDSKETSSIIPGKIFEYFSVKRPILAIGPKQWDVKYLLEQTKTGECFTYTDKNNLKKYIEKMFVKYQQGILEINPSSVAMYTRENITKELAKIIDSIS